MPAESRSTVLIVEDDPGVAILQRRRLERAGFAVELATEVETALTALGRGGIDIVLLDYRLGETTGLDLHRRMKAGGHHVPVILVSGAMEDVTLVEALRTGVRDVIVKTTGYLDSLPDAVRGVLAQGQAGAVGEAAAGGFILVVEDDPGTAKLEHRRLERAGYAVRVATTGEEAAAMVRKGGVGLALLDLQLPGGVSGLDLYAQWISEGFAVPAILITGYPDQAVVIRALRMGIRDFVPKSPDFIEYLPTAVDRVMSQVDVERRLAESELRLASVIGTTLDAILMSNAGGRIVLSNTAAQHMFGLEAADMLGLHVTTLIPGLGLETNAPPGQFRERRELDAVHGPTGARVPIEVAVTDVAIREERLFTVIARDITDRRRAEAERREADRRKDEFLGMLGHELRNPLAAIMSASEVMHQRSTDPAMQKMTAVLRRQARALARMVDDLLDVSRVTLAKIELRREPLLLGPALARVVEGGRDAARRAGLGVAFDECAEPLWLDADPTRLDQVLANLLTNAVKFTPAGGQIQVTCDREGDTAVVTVRDTGVGMPASLVPHVFDLFVQGDQSLDRPRSGLGIGLALVRQIVALHGGSVTAESAGPGAGSRFTVRLPLVVQDDRPLTEPAEAGPAAERRLRVLVVDDQPDVADAVTLLIAGLGHSADGVYDAEKALAFVRRERVDVIVADVGMPGMSGLELAESIRRDPNLGHVRLIALTGYGRDEDRAGVAAAGFDLHLTKPVTDSALQKALADLSPSAAGTGP